MFIKVKFDLYIIIRPLESCICVTFINEIPLCFLGGLNDTHTLRLKVMKGFWLNMA